jgi:hypothetical protein
MAKPKFKHGHKKVGGRKKGAKNKKTLVQEAFCMHVVTGGQEKFEREMNRLKGRSYVMSYIALMEYCVAKKSRVEVENVTPPPEYDLSQLSTEELLKYKELQNKMKTMNE